MRETYFSVSAGEVLLQICDEQPRFPGIYWTADTHGVDYIAFRAEVAIHIARLLTHRHRRGKSRIAAAVMGDEILFDLDLGRLEHNEANMLGYLDFTVLAALLKPCPPPVAPPLPTLSPPTPVLAAVEEILGMWSPEFSITAAIYARALLDGVLAPLDDPCDWPLVPIAVGANPDRPYRVGPVVHELGNEAWEIGVSGVHSLALGCLHDIDSDIRVGPKSPQWLSVDLQADVFARHGVSLHQLGRAFGGDVYAVAAVISSPSTPGEPGIDPR
ncbi:hypothetical protein L3Q67_01605 [Saccharothrix sp. AJ9571]|nr:hypothetical protein L3Q67_01605 [Saccharothrix sp. AJ9571]